MEKLIVRFVQNLWSKKTRTCLVQDALRPFQRLKEAIEEKIIVLGATIIF